MMRRMVWIGGAVLLAAGVLGLSLWVGSPGMENPGENPSTPVSESATSETDNATPNVVPYNPDQRVDPDRIDQTTPGTGDGGRYVFQDSDRTTFLAYKRFDARPLGVIDITEPTADIVFSPSRVVSIRADRATIVAPENQLRSGAFQGNVVVTLHQADAGQVVDPRAEDHVQLRVHLEEADFDIELGSLESTGDIRLVGQRVAFEGAGLSMTYNDLQGRIERLEVYRGKSLRFKPNAALSRRRDFSRVEKPTVNTSSPSQTVHRSESNTPADPDPFYRARFENDVKLRGEANALRMDGDFLDVTFALGEGTLGDENAAAPQENETTSDSLSLEAEGGVEDENTPSPTNTQANEKPDHHPKRESGPETSEDIVITWTGRLLIVPEESPPADLTLGGPDAVLMRLAGKPVSIVTPDDQTVVAAEVDYLTSTGRLRAAAGPDSAMVIHDPAVGTLRGTRLAIDQQRGSGFVIGPGQLESTDDPDASLTVAWDDRLDLRFYPRQEDIDEQADDPMVNLDRLAGIRSAEFRGNVAAYEKRFDITAEQLAVHLDPPADSDSDPTLDRIDASGDVRLNATDDNANPWHIAGQELTVGLDTDEQGDPYPTRITARDDVATTLPPMPDEADGELAFNGLDLTAGLLDVTLEPGSGTSVSVADTEVSTQGSELGNDLAVHRFVAEDDVRVTLHGTDVELAAERMSSRGTDRLDLFGNDADPARIQRGGDRLAGSQIVISRDGQTVEVPGAGMLDARLTARDDLDSDQADLMTVVWTDAMRYDHAAGDTSFAGDVRVTTASPDGLDRTRLTSDDLELTLTENTDETEAAHVNTGPASGGDNPFFGDRTIDTVTATGNARFVAERDTLTERDDPFDETEPRYRRLEARLTLKGPSITFNRDDQKVTVPAAGAMIVQNYADVDPNDVEPQPVVAAPGSATPVNFTGQGETLFTWTDSLTLDAAGNDMLMRENVRMIHRPPTPKPSPESPESESDSPKVVQLDADRLLANLRDTGGLDALLAGAQPQPEIETIEADGDVSVLYDGKLIAADEMDYVEAKRTIAFTANADRLVRVRDGNEPRAGLEAEAISWNLDTDKLTISEVEGGTLPVSRE